jgi:succinoglycan biosynthesis protein ExoA
VAPNPNSVQEPGGILVSVIVACRDEARRITAFVNSLLSQDTGPIVWEIIIADGMSDDGTREVLRKYVGQHSQVLMIDNPGRIVSTGLNAAIRASRGEIIIRMDAHTEYAPDYIRQCVAVLEESGADNVGGPARTKAEGYLPRAIAAAYHSRFSSGGAKFREEDYEGDVDSVTYGCWRKSTLERLGLFDEALVRNQDDELNLRLVRSGGKIWQSRAIVSWYRPRTTLSSLFRQYFQYGFWKIAVIRKHQLPASWRHLVPGTFVLVNLILILAIIGAWTAAWRPVFKFSLAALAALAALDVAYLAACLVAALAVARRNDWRLFPILPVVFAAFHFSYGIGFLLGLVAWPLNGPRWARLGKLFTGITR